MLRFFTQPIKLPVLYSIILMFCINNCTAMLPDTDLATRIMQAAINGTASTSFEEISAPPSIEQISSLEADFLKAAFAHSDIINLQKSELQSDPQVIRMIDLINTSTQKNRDIICSDLNAFYASAKSKIIFNTFGPKVMMTENTLALVILGIVSADHDSFAQGAKPADAPFSYCAFTKKNQHGIINSLLFASRIPLKIVIKHLETLVNK